MKRRSFFRFAALSGFGLVSGRGTAEENVQNRGDSAARVGCPVSGAAGAEGRDRTHRFGHHHQYAWLP